MSPMKIRLLDRKELAHETMGFVFEKPAGFTFKAGQSGDFTLIHPPETDAEGDTRAFSLCNPPDSKDLMIATRMRNTAFKRVLKQLPLGTELAFSAPFGSFTLHNNKTKPAVFLTGGIGVTPVRSIVLQAAQEKLPHKIFLFFANNSLKESAFLEELAGLQTENINYRFIATLAKVEPTQMWKGETGYINEAMIRKHVRSVLEPIYYICGPAPMVAAMRKVLIDMGVDDDDVRTEEFSGY